MDKRKLSKIPQETASDEMLKFAERATGTHIVTCTEIEKDLLMLMFYPVKGLKKGKREARIRTFFSKTDYITQDLSVSKVKWMRSTGYLFFGKLWAPDQERVLCRNCRSSVELEERY